jgi:formyl-CoA transferase
MVDDPRFATIATRHQYRDETDAAVAVWMKTQKTADVEREFAKVGIPAAAVKTYAETAANPHVIERDMLQPIEQEDGKTVPITGPAAKFSRTPTKVRARAAKLGEHTEEILAELGMNPTDVRRLRATKVI